MIVVADTSPVNYLLQLNCIDRTLPQLYDRVLLPADALAELQNIGAPSIVKQWASTLPSWITVASPSGPLQQELKNLGPGECAAISIALEQDITTVLLDDHEARLIAEDAFHLRAIGTLGVL